MPSIGMVLNARRKRGKKWISTLERRGKRAKRKKLLKKKRRKGWEVGVSSANSQAEGPSSPHLIKKGRGLHGQ